MMVLASGTSLSPSGQLIQLGPANVLVLQSLDANDQEFQSSPIIVQADEQSKISVTDGKTVLMMLSFQNFCLIELSQH